MFRSALRTERPLEGEWYPDNDNQSAPRPAVPIAVAANSFRSLSMWLLLSSCLTALILAMVFKVRVDPTGSSIVVWAVAAMLLASRIWWDRTGQQAIADAAGTIGVVSLGAMSGGAIAMLELRFGFPKADTMLHQADLALAVDGIRIAKMVAAHRDAFLPILAPIYNFTVEFCFASLVALSLMRDRVEAWRAAFIFTGSLLTVCAVAVFIPATGLINWAPPEVLTYLPNGFMPHFQEFYYGVDPVLRLQVIDGVITFPSFHAVVGCLVCSMWRKRLVTRVIVAAWLIVELLSTVTGGHYVIDLVGGFVVWAAWFGLSKIIEQRAMAITA
ncbi:MAG: phosphatase PAP2 family protein [Sphingomonas sp.]|nr:phosphatase PAP2 family protein [Sphingomonas sp.]